MSNNIDRIDFYEKLKGCKTRSDIENLIDNIDNEDLYSAMLDKYNQIIEYNKNTNDNKLVEDIIKILEFSYLKFEKSMNEENN